MKPIAQSHRRSAIRPGETAIPVARHVVPHTDGASKVTLSIDLGDTPVPDRRYLADVCAIDFDGATVRWCFGQRKVGKVGAGLRSLVVIHIAPEHVHNLLGSLKQFIGENAAFLGRNKIERIPLTELSDEPPQTVALCANVVAVARAGREGCLDFYSISAHAIHAINQVGGDKLAIDPMIRVDLPIGLMTSAIDWIVDFAKQTPGELT